MTNVSDLPPPPSARLAAWFQPLLALFALAPFLAIAGWLLAEAVRP